MSSVDSLLLNVSEAVKLQIDGETALNKSGKEIFGRLLGPSEGGVNGGGGLLYARVLGQIESMTTPLSNSQIERLSACVKQVLDSAFSTYTSWIQANDQILDTLSTLQLPEGATTDDELNLVDIVKKQQAISLVIQSRYDGFLSKLDDLMKTVDLSVDAIKRGGYSLPGSLSLIILKHPPKLSWAN